MLIERGLVDISPRVQFTIDIIECIRKLRLVSQDYIILALDANNPIATEPNGLNKIKNECNLIDPYIHIHHDHEDFPTQQRGSKRIDHLICSPNILQFIEKIGYVRFNEVFDTDHRTIFCDISERILETNHNIETKKVRMVGTNSTNEEGENYIRNLHHTIQCHNIFNQVNNMYESIKNKDLTTEEIQEIIHKLNIIDNIITELKLKNEKKYCAKKDPALWSPQLYQSHLRVQYINVKKKAKRQRTDASKRLQNIWDKMDETTRELINNAEGTLKKQLREAIKLHQQLIMKHREIRLAYLQEKLDDLNEREPDKKDTSLNTLINREKQRADFAKLRKVFKKREWERYNTSRSTQTRWNWIRQYN
jgi:hypothetical protein